MVEMNNIREITQKDDAYSCFICVILPSRPIWARGLKYYIGEITYHVTESRPIWARGLKLQTNEKAKHIRCRALYGRVD